MSPFPPMSAHSAKPTGKRRMTEYGPNEQRAAYESYKNRNAMFQKLVEQIDKTHPDHIACTILIPNTASHSESVCVTSNAVDIMRRLPGQESAVDVFCRQLVNARDKRNPLEADRIFRWKIPDRINDEYAQSWLEDINHNQLRTACRKLNKVTYQRFCVYCLCDIFFNVSLAIARLFNFSSFQTRKSLNR